MSFHVCGVTEKKASEIRTFLAALRPTRWPRDAFIGNHPRELTKEMAPKLDTSEYYYTEKKDGLRVLLIYEACVDADGEPRLFLMDRNNNIEEVASDVAMSQRQSFAEDVSKIIHIVDGELCFETHVGGAGEEKFKYTSLSLDILRDLTHSSTITCIVHVFDALVLTSRSVVKDSFTDRYCNLKTIIDSIATSISSTAFSLRLKPISQLSQLQFAANAVQARSWEGLILYKKNATYHANDKNSLLRWKNSSSITVDLLVERSAKPGYTSLQAQEGPERSVEVALIPDSSIAPYRKEHRCKIGEFRVGGEGQAEWVLVRWRPDKASANSYVRVKSLLNDTYTGPADVFELLKLLESKSADLIEDQ